MKSLSTCLFMAALGVSASAVADVKVNIHRDIAPLVVNGEGVGFSVATEHELQLDNGLNQLVIRIEKLVQNSYGEREKFNSLPMVLSFEAKDTELVLAPQENIMRTAQAKEFDASPRYTLTLPNGEELRSLEYKILPNGGGVLRDFEEETTKFNAKHSIVLSNQTKSASTFSSAGESTKDTVEIEEMYKHWYQQANSDEQDVFLTLALASRKSGKQVEVDDDSRAVKMMAYWFNKANSKSRKLLLGWSIQEN